MDNKDHGRGHNLTLVVSPDKLHVKMTFCKDVMQFWWCISLFNKQNIWIETLPSLQPRVQMHISLRVQG